MRITVYLSVAVGTIALLDRGYDLAQITAALPVLVAAATAAALGLVRSVRAEQAG